MNDDIRFTQHIRLDDEDDDDEGQFLTEQELEIDTDRSSAALKSTTPQPTPTPVFPPPGTNGAVWQGSTTIGQAKNPVAADQQQEIAKTIPYRPSMRPPVAQLRFYYDDQRNFDRLRLSTDRFAIGRTDGDLVVAYDPLMSSRHAEIERRYQDGNWQWVLRDVGSTNGTFINVDRARLKDGDELLMGGGRYRFQQSGEQAMLQLIDSGTIKQELVLPVEGICVGRDQSHLMSAFWDPQLDAKHAFLQQERSGVWCIKNLQSVNGIWYRITELTLLRKCFFQMGEQRFGFQA